MTATTACVKDLKADELDLVELVMAYDKEFKISIRDAEADKFVLVRPYVPVVWMLTGAVMTRVIHTEDTRRQPPDASLRNRIDRCLPS